MLYIIISHFISRSLNIPGYFQFINEISINLRKSAQISVNLRNLKSPEITGIYKSRTQFLCVSYPSCLSALGSLYSTFHKTN